MKCCICFRFAFSFTIAAAIFKAAKIALYGLTGYNSFLLKIIVQNCMINKFASPVSRN